MWLSAALTCRAREKFAQVKCAVTQVCSISSCFRYEALNVSISGFAWHFLLRSVPVARHLLATSVSLFYLSLLLLTVLWGGVIATLPTTRSLCVLKALILPLFLCSTFHPSFYISFHFFPFSFTVHFNLHLNLLKIVT